MSELNFDDLIPQSNEINFDDLIPQETAAQQGSSFTDKLSENYANREGNVAEIVGNRESGVFGDAEAAIHSSVQAAMLPFDAIGSGLAQGFESLPDSAQETIKDTVSSGIDTIANTNIPYSQNTIGDVANQAIQGYEGLEKEYPAATQRLESLVNVGGVAAPFVRGAGGKSLASASLGMVEPAVKTAGKGATAVAKPIAATSDAILKKMAESKRTGLAPKLTSSEIKEMSRESYKFADDSGGTLKATVTDKFVDKIKSLDNQTSAGQIFSGENAISDLAKRVDDPAEGLRGKTLSLQAAQEIDEKLGEMIEKNTTLGKVDKVGVKFIEMQDEFRDLIENATESDLIGGKDGFEALKRGRALWSASLRQADIEKILERADQMDNPVKGIQTGFRTLANNPKRMRGYTKQEQKLIKEAAKTGIGTDLLRLAGSRLIPIITGVGAVTTLNPASLLAVGGTAASGALARKAATKIQTKKANRLSNEVQKRVSPRTENLKTIIKN